MADITLNSTRISRTPDHVLDRYMRRVRPSHRDEHIQVIHDLPVFDSLRLRLARHLTDALLIDGRPLLYLMLDRAVSAWLSSVDKPRRERMATILSEWHMTWLEIPVFMLYTDRCAWQAFAGSDLMHVLATAERAHIYVDDPSCVRTDLSVYLLDPWPKLKTDLLGRTDG